MNLFNMWVRYGCYLCLQQLDILNLVTWSEKQLHESLSLLKFLSDCPKTVLFCEARINENPVAIGKDYAKGQQMKKLRRRC